MTLISGFFIDGCPILMGDLLVSDEDKADKEFVFPTAGKVSKRDIRNGIYSPSHLCQKAILISPKLAICWANKKIYASSFIEEIINANGHINPSHELLSAIYNDIGGPGNLSIVGIYRDGMEMRIFDYESWPVDHPYPGFRYFKAVGSGYASLLDMIPNLGMGAPSRKINKLERGISTAIHFITSLLSKEIIDPSSLKDLFGVGYEIIHPLGDSLAKFTKLTYVFWTALEEESGNWKLLPFPFLSFNYSYIGDILIIRCARASSLNQKASCKIDSDELHVISPIHRDLNPDKLRGYSPASFNSEWMCNVFLWKNCQGNVGSFASFGHYPNQSAPIIWTNEFTKDEGIDVNIQFVKASISKIGLQAYNDK